MDSALARLVLRLSSAAEGLDSAADAVLADIRDLVEAGADDERLDKASAQLAHVLAARAGREDEFSGRLAHLAHDLADLVGIVDTLPVRGDEQGRLSMLLQQARSASSAQERQRALAEFIALASDALRDVARRESQRQGESLASTARAESERHTRATKELLLRIIVHLDASQGNALRSHALRERLEHTSHFEQLQPILEDIAAELDSADEQLRIERSRIAAFFGALCDRLDGCELELGRLGLEADPGNDSHRLPAALGERLRILRDEASALQNEIRNKIDIDLKDSLTGVYSRSGFDERCAELMERWKHSGATFSMVMVECLQFHDINQQRGHAAGDRLLVKVADLLQSRGRAGDVIGRYDSEHFAVLLPVTSIEGAEAFAANVSEALAQGHFEDRAEMLQLDLACGVTGLVVGDTLESVIGRAGEALHEARQNPQRRVSTVI